MTVRKLKTVVPRLEELVVEDRDLLKSLAEQALNQVLQAEMSEFLGAAPGERSDARSGYRAGYYSRGLITRIGKIELRVPRDRQGEFRRRCLSASSGARRRWSRRWRRCMCKG